MTDITKEDLPINIPVVMSDEQIAKALSALNATDNMTREDKLTFMNLISSQVSMYRAIDNLFPGSMRYLVDLAMDVHEMKNPQSS